MTTESNAYILGTDREELHRLGLQHQVWAQVARESWTTAGFGRGHNILDLGSGPGFCSFPLAYMVGNEGKVIAIDKSKAYIDYIQNLNKSHQLNIDSRAIDFDDMQLDPHSLDGMYCRWALAWIQNPEEILSKVYKALKPGGRIVIHEYYDWSTFQMEPHKVDLQNAINNIFKSFSAPPSNINIGKKLPAIFKSIGLEIIYQRPLPKLASPKDLNWQWPYTFLHIYLPKLIDMGLMDESEVDRALNQLEELTNDPTSTIFCPVMVELIAQKSSS